ncbi:MAG TPA: VCBS repeat-containing protein [Salinimicrobium sp.]|nr:VCBS repeat-containing protein [Salinimicrobium sp.]
MKKNLLWTTSNFDSYHSLGQFLSIFILFIFLFSCSDDDTQYDEIDQSGDKNLISLVFEYDSTDYPTSIDNTSVTNSTDFPFFAEEVLIKSFEISENASTNISIGQILNISNDPLSITVTAEDGISKNYSLSLSKDEGLNLSPNMNIEMGSSYSLQGSDVYVEPNQLTQDFDKFYEAGYADFNNDGHTDVLLASGVALSFDYSPILLYLGDGTGVNPDYCECGGECVQFSCNSFTQKMNALPSGYEGLQSPRKILLGDYNSDNLTDVFILGHGYDAPPFPGESPALLINNGDGFNYEKFNNVSGFYHGGSSADFDNDGDIDIYLVGSIFLINDGAGNFTKTSEFIDNEFPPSAAYYTSEFIDINSDGYIDLLVAGHEHEGAPSYILWGNSSGKYYKDLSSTIPPVSGYNIVIDIDTNDIDGDGDKDLIMYRVNSDIFYLDHYIQVVENDENINFNDVTESAIVNSAGIDAYDWIHLQDLNNDGNIDIYLDSNHKPNIKWHGDGNGGFN